MASKAFPALSNGAVPMEEPESNTVTLPEGVPAPPPAATTVMLSVTVSPNTLGFGVAASVVAVGLLSTAVEAEAEESRKLLSPP